MIGPPGSGKTMLSQRLPTILPEPVFEEALQTTRIYSAVGLLGRNGSVMTVRPFRSPHHTVSDAGPHRRRSDPAAGRSFAGS